MEKEDQIIGMLEKIMGTLDEHGRILKEHSKKHDEHSAQFKEHGTQLKEHGQLLTALRSGQEHLKAEIDGMKIGNAKEFGALKEEISLVSTNQELIREDTWANKVDIHRIKNTMGIK
ncbi:hypothetical protein ACFOUV_15020 [Oceanobacillus longus]|uniref:Uncharacterized protein n=1 Tax=Oceanobacillus longus TaxID=930120 RepID=A0ABV8H2L7_9BACI